MVYSITSQIFVGKLKHQWKHAAKWVNKLKFNEKIEILDEQNKNFFYYNKQYDSHYETSSDNYVAMIENKDTIEM